ncbi:MAG: acetylxylan esterase [Chitinispirillaceae bacterium]|nr:acetylxylan esterase [Chitinispirillaceae bacterium]
MRIQLFLIILLVAYTVPASDLTDVEFSTTLIDSGTVYLSCNIAISRVSSITVTRTTDTDAGGYPIADPAATGTTLSLLPESPGKLTATDIIDPEIPIYYYIIKEIVREDGSTYRTPSEQWIAVATPWCFSHGNVDGVPVSDRRYDTASHVNIHCTLRDFQTLVEWVNYRSTLIEHIKITTGLSPFFDSSSIGRITFSDSLIFPDYTVYNVFFESFEGYLCTGNLYKPHTGSPPYPAILCPHGHWKKGRFEHSGTVSVPNRCISLARMGCYVFSYDMVGYRDSYQLAHWFDGYEKLGVVMNDTLAMWGISSMGLMLLNGIRAVDFVLTLPDVDTTRIGMTGASGGGIATFFNTALDNRIGYPVPVNMTSTTHQGGCICCNAPALRYWTNNVEITACAAPRPLHLISASGDWTTATPKVEFPALQAIYDLYSRKNEVSNTHITANHNYNRESRESAYRFFGNRFFNLPDTMHYTEENFNTEYIDHLLVFKTYPHPEYAKPASELIGDLIAMRRNSFERFLPSDEETTAAFRNRYSGFLRHILSLDNLLPASLDTTVTGFHHLDSSYVIHLSLSNNHTGSAIPVTMHVPDSIDPVNDSVNIAFWVHDEGRSSLYSPEDNRYATLTSLVDNGCIVVSMDPFNTGEHIRILKNRRNLSFADYLQGIKENDTVPALALRSESAVLEAQSGVTESEMELDTSKVSGNFFISYNKTDCLLRIEDIYHVITFLQKSMAIKQLTCVGLGDAGLWCTIALTQTQRVNNAVLDLNGFNSNATKDYTERLFIPHLRAVGGFAGAAGFVNADKVLLFNSGDDSSNAATTKTIYRALSGSKFFFRTQWTLTSDDITTMIEEDDGFSRLTDKYRNWHAPPVESVEKDDGIDYFRICRNSDKKIVANYSISVSGATGSISIYNLSGMLLRKDRITSPKGRWVGHLNVAAAGIYCIRLQWGEASMSRKVTIIDK